jgi:hypothetical protein
VLPEHRAVTTWRLGDVAQCAATDGLRDNATWYRYGVKTHVLVADLCHLIEDGWWRPTTSTSPLRTCSSASSSRGTVGALDKMQTLWKQTQLHNILLRHHSEVYRALYCAVLVDAITACNDDDARAALVARLDEMLHAICSSM